MFRRTTLIGNPPYGKISPDSNDSTYLDKKLFFSINISIPDTDVGSDFVISVSNKGEMEIKEVYLPLEGDEE